ncbi:HIT family protein [Streptomyces radicis]|nr:HIT family protein [Streptomyces radicis]
MDGAYTAEEPIGSNELSGLDKRPMDLAAYERRVRSGPCFLCAMAADDPAYRREHEVIHEDAEHMVFLARWATLPGTLLVAPKAHVEGVVRDLDEAAYARLTLLVRRAALALETVLRPERTYLLSLGAQQGNAHVHWHVAGLPPGVPYEQQQYHALMAENGVLEPTREEKAALADRLRAAFPGP